MATVTRLQDFEFRANPTLLGTHDPNEYTSRAKFLRNSGTTRMVAPRGPVVIRDHISSVPLAEG